MKRLLILLLLPAFSCFAFDYPCKGTALEWSSPSWCVAYQINKLKQQQLEIELCKALLDKYNCLIKLKEKNNEST